MNLPKARRSAASALLAAALLGGCSNADTASGDEPASPTDRSAAFDPLQYESPAWPEVPDGKPTEREMDEVIQFAADACTFGLRTGFQRTLRSVGCDCSWNDDVWDLAEDGLHAETDPVRVEVLRRSVVYRANAGWHQYRALIEVTRPALTVADASGEVVRREPEDVYQVEVVLSAHVDLERWDVTQWQESRQASA
ncbi:hypothetical protein ACFP3Q_02675 [Nocardioides sp. GCM10027113]|uniref:hypothetical protein n=1 Tax=unclassified Nocardioides TaxID=2615069 RepID=UPI0036196C34